MVRMWKIATNEKQKVKFVKRKVWGKKVEMKMRWWKVEGFPTAEDWKLCCDPVAMLNGNYHRKSQFIAFIETDHYSNYFDNHKNMVKLEQVCFNENKFSFHMTHEKLSLFLISALFHSLVTSSRMLLSQAFREKPDTGRTASSEISSTSVRKNPLDCLNPCSLVCWANLSVKNQ